MKVAVLGYGTVGYGVYEMLGKASGLEQGPVLVRPGKKDAPFKVTSIEEIVSDPSVGAVAEVMGGVEPAYTYAAAAIKAGKHFVTSNKALVAAKGVELNALAREAGVAFLFSAACGGGVPFLHNLALARESDQIRSLGGILNGTTNYMLDAMQRLGLDYADVLRDAQRLGYAEADPTADVSGLDALRKIMLACAVAYDRLPDEGLLHEGIESVTAADVKHFQSKGYTCRLLAQGGISESGAVFAYVEPVLVRDGAPECSVLQNYNMARYEGECSGPIVLMGQGAGRWPTASAVLRDLSGILRGERAMLQAGCERAAADNSGSIHSYYVRLDAGQDEFEAESCEQDGATIRLITQPLSVAEMHSKVKALREKGVSVFFAEIGG